MFGLRPVSLSVLVAVLAVASTGCDVGGDDPHCGGPTSELPFSCGGPTSEPPSMGANNGGVAGPSSGQGGADAGAVATTGSANGDGLNTGSTGGAGTSGTVGGTPATTGEGPGVADAGTAPDGAAWPDAGNVVSPQTVADLAPELSGLGSVAFTPPCAGQQVCEEASAVQDVLAEGFEGTSLWVDTASVQRLDADPGYLIVRVTGVDTSDEAVGLVVVLESTQGGSEWIVPGTYGPGPARVLRCGESELTEVQATVQLHTFDLDTGFEASLLLEGDDWSSEVALSVPSICEVQ